MKMFISVGYNAGLLDVNEFSFTKSQFSETVRQMMSMILCGVSFHKGKANSFVKANLQRS